MKNAAFAVSCVLLPFGASAATPTLGEVIAASGVSASGYVDASYVFNFNKGDSLAGRTFDSETSTFTVNQAALTISKLPAEGFGGLVNVIAGDDATILNGSYGDGGGKFNLTQAYVQYATGPLTVIGGRYVTLAGAEVINDTQNTNISRSFLFTLAQPLVHTGVRSSMKFGNTVTGFLGVANSAVSGQARDNNKQKTIEAGVLFAPSSMISVGLYDYYGFEPNGGEQQKVNYADLVLSVTPAGPFSFVLNADYVKAFSTDNLGSSDLKGVAAYFNFRLAEALKLSIRAEYLQSKNGFGIVCGDDKCDVQEVTATVDYAASKNFNLLGEVRFDKSGDDVYPNGNDPAKDSQGDVAIKAIYKFGT